jgi:hypothetical protein
MAPTQFPKTVFDKDGQRYRIVLKVAGNVVLLELCRGSRPIGYARCLLEGPSLQLSDLTIKEFALGGLAGMLRRMLPGTPKTYRGNGLGTALLKQVMATAQDLGIHTIYGSVTQADLDTTPYLLDWYKRQGFQVEKPTGEGLKNAVAQIRIDLGQG